MRAELIVDEMSSAVRLLGGDGPAKAQNTRVARLTGLSITTIERLRWKKIKRVPADIADAIREALAREEQEGLKRVKHELFLEQAKRVRLEQRLAQYSPH